MTPDAIDTVAVLSDGVRRRLYFHVRDSTTPVSRDDAAGAAGISRKLAAFHLEKLVDAGLVEPLTGSAGRLPGRTGRAPKLYRPSRADIAIHLPARHYDLVAAISLAAIRLGGPDPEAAVLQAARDRGADIGRSVRGALRPGRLELERALRLTMQALTQQGYEPQADVESGPPTIALRNCPFRGLLEGDDLVCRLNCALVEGVLVGLDAGVLEAVPTDGPGQGRCCVTVRAP
jgi:predicted ArsR family transcriptional regulator